MKTRAVRMYGEMDLRLEEFELPEIKDDEILVKVISDSICMSTYKLAKQGKKHKRAPQDIDVNPIITGHECSGVIVEVGDKWKDKYKVGDKWAFSFAILPDIEFYWLGGLKTIYIGWLVWDIMIDFRKE